MQTKILNRGEIKELAVQALSAADLTTIAAESLALTVAAAEMDGIKSHGLVYVPIYCEHLQCGKVIGTAVPQVEWPAGASVVVDAGSGFAHPAIHVGFVDLIPAVKKLGCAGLAVRNSYKCGVLGHHVERLPQSGLIGLGFTNAPASIMPVGGITPVIGTNPFALAVSDGSGSSVVMIEQSASGVAKSEIKSTSRPEKPCRRAGP